MMGYFEDGVRTFMVLEFAPGGDLSSIPLSEMSEARVAYLLKEMAKAVNHCHENGIIHRDIKVLLVLKLQNVRVACYRRYQSSRHDDTMRLTSHRTVSFSWTHMLIL